MSSLSIRGIRKVYTNGVEVLKGIDIEIKDGQFLILVGGSGSGKSTLLNMVAGLESVTSGEILIDGKVVNDLPPKDRDIAMVFQSYALYPSMTVRENIAFGLNVKKVPKAEQEEIVARVAETLQITHLLDRRPAQLSGGQRQRVAMGRAISRKPSLFLFDEPLSNLDALLRSEMRTEIKKLHQRIGATTIYVTHDQVEAMTLAERIVVLSGGNIMQVGTPDQIYNEPVSKFVAGFTGSPPMNFLGAKVARNSSGQVEIVLGTARLDLPPAAQAACGKLDGRQVEFGIRPEDITLDAAGPASAPLTATVVVVEPLGAETLVIFQCQGGELTARLPPTFALAPGQQVTVHLDMEKFHLFDPQGGAVLPSK